MLKGRIQPNHIPVNKFSWAVIGMPALTIVELSGIEEELEVVDLPDRTVASGGNTKAVEFTIMMPMHHTVEQAAMEQWFADCTAQKVGHRKSGALAHQAVNDAAPGRTWTTLDCILSKRKLPDLAMTNEGELALVEWTVRATRLIPV